MDDVYPNVKRAALAIAYDNNMINRERTEETFLARVAALAGPMAGTLDAALSVLDNDQIELLCIGEDSEQRAILSLLPAPYRAGVHEFLNSVFEEA